MSTLLILTTGRTDVQLVVNGARREFDKNHCARLHDELAHRRAEWRIIDTPQVKSPESVEHLPEGQLLLCTPKLDAFLRVEIPTEALLLETCRDSIAEPGDPRHAGAVLEARLAEKGVKEIHRRAYMQGKERMEQRNDPRDQIIRREIVQRLEDFVCGTVANIRPSRIAVIPTGGFPGIGDLVAEIARLHGAGCVDVYEINDGTKARPPGPDRAVVRTHVPDAIVSFQARRRALELINSGSLLGAWAVAVPLQAEESERAWVQVVEWLQYFACALPMPRECDLAILAQGRLAVRAALRVELALRAKDIPKAVHGTVAFFESALWDHLNGKISARRERLFKFDVPPPAALICRNKTDRDRPFQLRSGPDWYFIDTGKNGSRRLVEDYLQLNHLAELGRAISKRRDNSTIRDLRNEVAHSEPTPELMQHACKRMQDENLWSSTNTFLSQPLVQAVLQELGVKEPDGILDSLLADVRNRLVFPRRSPRVHS